jgi:hypothetical protein
MAIIAAWLKEIAPATLDESQRICGRQTPRPRVIVFVI